MVGALPVVERGWEKIQRYSAGSGLKWLLATEWYWELDRVGRAKCLDGLPERDPSLGKVVLYGRESLD